MIGFGVGEFLVMFTNFLVILLVVSVPVVIIYLLVKIYKKTKSIEELLKREK